MGPPGRGGRRREGPAARLAAGPGEAHASRCGSPASGTTGCTSSTPRWSPSTSPTPSTMTEGHGRHLRRPPRRRGTSRATTSSRRALALVGPHAPTSRSTSRSRPAPASAAGPPTPPRSCAGPATRDLGAGGGAGRRRALLRRRRPGPGAAASASVVEPLPVRGADLHPPDAAAALLDGRGLRAPGTSWAGRRARTATTWSRPRWPSCPELARWRDELAKRTGPVPMLAGSGSTWFVEGSLPGEGRRVVRTTAAVKRRDYLPARRCQRVRFSIFLCFFLRMRLRRFLISDPMSGVRGYWGQRPVTASASTRTRDPLLPSRCGTGTNRRPGTSSPGGRCRRPRCPAGARPTRPRTWAYL